MRFFNVFAITIIDLEVFCGILLVVGINMQSTYQIEQEDLQK